MRFADNLTKSKVPEWDDKYIDYKLGKKKLEAFKNKTKFELQNSDELKSYFIKNFIELWLIPSELIKCNDFYLHLLNYASYKFKILENQLATYIDNRSNLLNNYHSTSTTSLDYFAKTTRHHHHDNIIANYLIEMNLMPYLPNKFKKFFIKRKKKHNNNNLSINNHNHHNGSHGHETFNISPKKLLINAILNYYMFLQLIKSYRSINITGFRKIVKKFDKNCRTKEQQNFKGYCFNNYSMFKDSISNNDSILNYENKISSYLFNDLLRSNEDKKKFSIILKNLSSSESMINEDMIHNNNSAILQMFVSGLFLGASLLLISYTIYLSCNSSSNSHIHKVLFPLWGGCYMVSLMAVLFLMDCFIWHRNNVNYKFIIFNQVLSRNGTKSFNNDFATTEIPEKLYFISFFILSLAIISFASFLNDDMSPYGQYFIIIITFLFFLPCLPFAPPYFHRLIKTQKALIVAGIRLTFSGIYPVEFIDFFLGDVISSLTYSMADLALLKCIISNNDPNFICSSSNLVSMGVLSCIPSYWRLMQCIRRYLDSGDWFPHALNALKYSFGVAYNASLSAYRISRHAPDKKTAFIIIATINSTCTSIWDILLDWSLLQPNSDVNPNPNFLLRKDLYFAGKRKDWQKGSYSKSGKLFYYIVMILDVVIRFQWIIYVITPDSIQQSAVTSFILATTEVIRRFNWILLRVENEHVANVQLLRVINDSPLPYPIDPVAHPEEFVIEEEDETDHLLPSKSAPQRNVNRLPQAHPYRVIQRRKTYVMDGLSKSIPWAHTTDFQAPKSFTSAELMMSNTKNKKPISSGGLSSDIEDRYSSSSQVVSFSGNSEY